VDTFELSLKMRRLAQWLDGQCPPKSFVRKRFEGRPYGNCYVTVDPGRQAPVASFNMNRVYLCGAAAGMDSGSIRRLIDLFASAGIARFFVWLSPGPDMETVRDCLEQSGLSRIRHVGYPTLCRTGHSPVPVNTDLDVREVSADEIAASREALGATPWPVYEQTASKPGFFHYMASDGKRPVAVAALCIFEDLGYLMAASTMEGDRKRGAQQALIAKRLQRVEQVGCAMAVSETLYMLEHSYRNLQRAGFPEACEKEVYKWNV
jgi:hypothetical protein